MQAPQVGCSTKLGDAVSHAGYVWVKVVDIESTNQNHFTIGSNDKKLSDDEINSLRGQFSGKLWLHCDGHNAYVDQPATPFTATSGWTNKARTNTRGTALMNCADTPDGPFATAYHKYQQHQGINCRQIYAQVNERGCHSQSAYNRPGALYVEVKPSCYKAVSN